MSDISMRILYLEKEIEMLNAQLNDMKEKLSNNPFTRDSFRPNLSFVWNSTISINSKGNE